MGRAGSGSSGSGGSRGSSSSGGSHSRSGSSSGVGDFLAGGIFGWIIGGILDVTIIPIINWICDNPIRSAVACVISTIIGYQLNQNPPGDAKALSVVFFGCTAIFYLFAVIRNWILCLLSTIVFTYGAYYHAFVLLDICDAEDSVVCFICLCIFIMPFFGGALYGIVNFILNGSTHIVERKYKKNIKNMSSTKRVDIKKADENMARHILNNQKAKSKKKKR